MIFTPVWKTMPSSSRARCNASLISGSSKGTMRGRASRTATATPARAKTWASSSPTALAPTTIMERGSSRRERASVLVR